MYSIAYIRCHNYAICRNEYLIFILAEYIQCNFYVNLNIRPGEMKESGFFFWTQLVLYVDSPVLNLTAKLYYYFSLNSKFNTTSKFSHTHTHTHTNEKHSWSLSIVPLFRGYPLGGAVDEVTVTCLLSWQQHRLSRATQQSAAHLSL